MLTRRAALALLVPPVARGALDRYFGETRGTAVLLDLRSRRVVGVHRAEVAEQWLVPPGSTLKPLSLWALLDSGKLRASDVYTCPRKLTIQGRRFDCSHPTVGEPMRVPSAIAYSCNCFVTHFAARFDAGELARFLAAHRLGSPAQISAASGMEDCELQAMGEARILVTPSALLNAYAELATRAPAPIVEGLEDAVEFGTAQLAASPKVKIAGKTGTVLNSDGARVVWFAGFAPSRRPEAAVVVAVQGRSGGLDAAPIGGAILAEYLAKK